MKEIDVTVIGSLNFDIIMKQDRLPNIGETFTANSVTTSPGGKGANQAVQCSKLGLTTHMLGAVGNDIFAQPLLSALDKYGVEHTSIKQVDNMTGLGVVNSLPNGELIATISKGANYNIDEMYIEEHIELIKKSKIIILQLEIPVKIVEKIISIARQSDCFIILNGAPGLPLAKEALQQIDCFVVNEEEASFYSQQRVETVEQAITAGKMLYDSVRGFVVVTVGAKGSIIYNGQEPYIFEPCSTEVVETTGAGDSYVGALAYGISQSYSIEQLGEFASKVSAITIQTIGAQNAMPYLQEIIS